ncbi:hypothetical protein K449DRAFT_148462 [Hypoxylon sp. EC38]|nr:hypothetical protein K449DRAFT_148462 [Hypoxylon sp. EC38]
MRLALTLILTFTIIATLCFLVCSCAHVLVCSCARDVRKLLPRGCNAIYDTHTKGRRCHFDDATSYFTSPDLSYITS